jgi:hypothetical protein
MLEKERDLQEDGRKEGERRGFEKPPLTFFPSLSSC